MDISKTKNNINLFCLKQHFTFFSFSGITFLLSFTHSGIFRREEISEPRLSRFCLALYFLSDSWVKLKSRGFVFHRCWSCEDWRLGGHAFFFQERLGLFHICAKETLLALIAWESYGCRPSAFFVGLDWDTDCSLFVFDVLWGLFFTSDSHKFGELN